MAGSKGQGAGRPETGDWRPETGNRKQETLPGDLNLLNVLKVLNRPFAGNLN